MYHKIRAMLFKMISQNRYSLFEHPHYFIAANTFFFLPIFQSMT